MYKLIKLSFLALSVSVLLLLLLIGHSDADATPKSFKELFIARCDFYQQIVNPEPFKNGRERNCSELWQKFSQAWIGKDPCQVPEKNYAEFVTEAYHTFPANEASLWEGLILFIRNYADGGKRVYHVALTLAGYLMDPFSTWCGSTSGGEGINYNNCPPPGKQCVDHPVMSFWKAVSVKYASALEGAVKLYLNGSIDVTYLHSSVMVTREIPNLNTSNVKLVDINLVNQIGKKVLNTCERGPSIEFLKKKLNERKLKFECQENPPSVLHYLCIDHPDDAKCKFASPSINGTNSLTLATQALAFMFIALIIFSAN